MPSKSIFLSKTLWLNVIGAVVVFVQGLPGTGIAVDPQTIAYVLAALNVANRLITHGPVHVLNDASTGP